MKRILLFTCTSMLAGMRAQAQTRPSTADSAQILVPVEVRSTRLNEKSPFAVSNLGKKEIAKQNLGQSFPYFFNQIPSVVISSDDGIGVGYSSLRVRGTDISRTNLTFNGIPVNDPEYQGIFFVNFGDLASSTSSVQLQRGVGSSTNGAGAFGASLNIYNIEQSKEATASISNSYGSFNTWKHTLQAASGLIGCRFRFDVRLSKISSDGYIQRSNSNLKSLQFIAGWTSKNEMTSVKFNLLSGKEKTGQAWNGIGTSYANKDDLSKVDYSKQLDNAGRNSNTLGKMANGTYYDNQTDNYQQDYYQLFLNHKFNPYWSSNISLFMTRGKGYYNEYKQDEKFKNYGVANPTVGDTTITKTNLIRQLWLDNYYYGSIFSANHNKNNTTLNMGGGYTQYDARHYGYVKWADAGFLPDYRWYYLPAFKRDINLYSKLQQQIAHNLYAFADMQVRNVNYIIKGFRKNPTLNDIRNHYTFFNPKAGLSYLVKHANTAQSKIYGSVAIANKEPNRDDFEADSKQAPKPEQLADIEVGYQFSSKCFEGSINGYFMKYKNQLIATGKINDVGAYARTNVDDSYRSGIEITADWKLLNWIQANANATFSQNKIKHIYQYSDDYDNNGQIKQSFTNNDISFSPNTVAGITVSLEPLTRPNDKQHFYIDLMEKYVSRQYLDNAQDKLKSINPYALTDARLRYQFATKNFKNVSLVFMANNLLNKKYENNGYTFSYVYGGTATTENYYYPQAGINWNVGLTLGF